MQHISTSRTGQTRGFTIVEIIVILTVVIILLPLVMNTLHGLYTANVTSFSRTTQNTNARSVLRTIEKDLAYSPGFLGSITTTSPLLGPSSSATGGVTWTANRNILIAQTYTTATTSGIRSPVIYQQSPSDDCNQPTNDMIRRNTVIYFVGADPSVSGVNNLYRRTLVGNTTTPVGTPCPGTPSTFDQKTTCRPSVTTGVCVRSASVGNDALILRDVDTLTLEYYALANSTSPLSPSSDPSIAQSARIIILPKQNGDIVPEEVSVRITPIR